MKENYSITEAFNTRNKDIICCTLRILQQLVTSADMIGEALVPYYRQILPILNVYKNANGKVYLHTLNNLYLLSEHEQTLLQYLKTYISNNLKILTKKNSVNYRCIYNNFRNYN